jgi:hypothetical protein
VAACRTSSSRCQTKMAEPFREEFCLDRRCRSGAASGSDDAANRAATPRLRAPVRHSLGGGGSSLLQLHESGLAAPIACPSVGTSHRGPRSA